MIPEKRVDEFRTELAHALNACIGTEGAKTLGVASANTLQIRTKYHGERTLTVETPEGTLEVTVNVKRKQHVTLGGQKVSISGLAAYLKKGDDELRVVVDGTPMVIQYDSGGQGGFYALTGSGEIGDLGGGYDTLADALANPIDLSEEDEDEEEE